MAEETEGWWVSRQGERFGPVSFAQMVEAARTGKLEPRTDMVIGPGIEDWKPACEVEGLFEKKAKEPPPETANRSRADRKREEAKKAAGHEAPADALADSGSYDAPEKTVKLNLPGAGRLGYFLGLVVLVPIVAIGLSLLIPQVQEMTGEKHASYTGLLMLAVPILVIVITVKRFQNLAMSGWWWLALMVPILNLWLNYRLFACPPGYNFTKKLDGIGKFLAVIYWLSLAAWVVGAVFFGAALLDAALESGKLEEWSDQIRQQIPESPEGG